MFGIFQTHGLSLCLFICDIMCRRDGTVKPFLGGVATEIITENVGYKLVVENNLVIFLQYESISISIPL